MARETSDHVAVAADWLAQICGAPRERRAIDQQALGDLDTDATIARAAAYLQHEAPEAVEGAGGDLETFRVAARVVDFGITEAMALELMLDHWNEQKASPPWQPEDLAAKVANAWRYRAEPAGIANPANEFEPIDLPEDEGSPFAKPPGRPKLFFELPRDVHATLDANHLVEDVLTTTGLAVIYGESNVGKTFIALDVAFHIATGRPWMGKAVQQGGVVYVAAEAGASSRNRIEALKRKHAIGDFPLALVPCPVDLLRQGADTAPLIALVKEAATAMGVPVRWVVVDTLSRALAGGNENGPEDMGAFVGNIDRLRSETGAAVAVVHHSGKDVAKGARGHSLLRAALDTELEVTRGVVQATKQRDMDAGPPVHFLLEVIDLGADTRGKRVTSCVVGAVSGAARDFGGKPPEPLTAEERQAHDALLDAQLTAAEKSEGDPDVISVPGSDWRHAAKCRGLSLFSEIPSADECRDLRPKTGPEYSPVTGLVTPIYSYANAKRSWYRLVTKLSDKGWIRKVGRDQYVSAVPPGW